MKKLLSLSALALAAMVASAPASAAIVVSFTPASSHINVGDTVAITMSISGLDDEILSAFDINMLFDSAVVRNHSVTHDVASQWGPDSVFGPSVFGVGDTDVFDYTLDDDDTVAASQANSFAVLTFGFTGLANGVTTIRLGDDLDFERAFVGRRFELLDVEVGTACLAVGTGSCGGGGNVPEPAGYGLAGLALLGAGWASRRRKPV
jgi:MYXO-CTERM domain-containing protein